MKEIEIAPGDKVFLSLPSHIKPIGPLTVYRDDTGKYIRLAGVKSYLCSRADADGHLVGISK